MRVLMVSDLYAPTIGGLETHVRMLAHALAERGHELTVATMTRPGSPAVEQDGPLTVRRLDGWTKALTPLYKDPERRFHPPAPDPGFARSLRRVVDELRPEIVHAHGWALYSALTLRRAGGPKLVVTLHDFSLVCAKKIYVYEDAVCSGPTYSKCVRCSWSAYGGPRGPLLASALRGSSLLHGRIDAAVAVSNAVAAAAAKALPPGRISVIPSFVDREDTAAAVETPRPAFLPRDDGYLLFVGALGPHKGLDVLLRAYDQLRTEVPLVVIGTPRHDTPASFPAGVVVATNVAHPQVMSAWAHSSVGVVPSTCPEGFGIVAAEAMAVGRPVVASAIGGLPDVVADGETGILVPPGDSDALRGALAALLADPERRAELGEAGRRRVQAFTAPVVAERVEHVYAQLLNS
jgi:glycosyltransferase involved in cell wall biosynthesis